jgi:hypothetical protein
MQARKANSSAIGACAPRVSTAQGGLPRDDAPQRGCAIVQRPRVFACCARGRNPGSSAAAALRKASYRARAQPRRLAATRARAVLAAPPGGQGSPRERCATRAAKPQRRPARARRVSSRARAIKRQQCTHKRHEHATTAYDSRIVSAQPVVRACRASRGERVKRNSAGTSRACIQHPNVADRDEQAAHFGVHTPRLLEPSWHATGCLGQRCGLGALTPGR